MKLKARAPFYHAELGLIKRGQVFDGDESLVKTGLAEKAEEPKKTKKTKTK